MFGFLEFLRVVALGLIAIVGAASLFFVSGLRSGLDLILLCSLILGIWLEPVLRIKRRHGRPIGSVIGAVEELLVREGVPRERLVRRGSGGESVLARAVYDYLLRTEDKSGRFQDQIHLKVAQAYFYTYSAYAIRIWLALGWLTLGLKTAILWGSFAPDTLTRFAEENLLLGLDPLVGGLLLAVLTAPLFLLSRSLLGAGDSRIAAELAMQHVFVADTGDSIGRIAGLIVNSPDCSLETFCVPEPTAT